MYHAAAVLAHVGWSVLLGEGLCKLVAEVATLKLLCLLDMMALHIGHAGHDTNASVWSNVHCSTHC